MATVGYGDIVATTSQGRIVAIFAMLLGASVFGYVVGNITMLFENIDPKAAALKAKMNDVKEFIVSQVYSCSSR